VFACRLTDTGLASGSTVPGGATAVGGLSACGGSAASGGFDADGGLATGVGASALAASLFEPPPLPPPHAARMSSAAGKAMTFVRFIREIESILLLLLGVTGSLGRSVNPHHAIRGIDLFSIDSAADNLPAARAVVKKRAVSGCVGYRNK
jgi:hypothetical protein